MKFVLFSGTFKTHIGHGTNEYSPCLFWINHPSHLDAFNEGFENWREKFVSYLTTKIQAAVVTHSTDPLSNQLYSLVNDVINELTHQLYLCMNV